VKHFNLVLADFRGSDDSVALAEHAQVALDALDAVAQVDVV